MEKLYKYYSVERLKRFLEMIRDHQLYAPTIDELNDAKEGALKFPKESSPHDRAEFIKILKNTHICSLSKLKNNGHMFAIYGNNHKGCCIELSVTARKWARVDVDYSETIPQISSTTSSSLSEALKIKSCQWGEESEVRYFRYYDESNKGKKYLAINIHRIMFGVKVQPKDYELYKTIINALDKRIDVVLLKEDDIDFGFKD